MGTTGQGIVVTATGLNLQMMGGVDISIDGKTVEPSKQMTYRGAMVSNVPNAAMVLGYTNSSWTLKADLIAKYVCDLLNHMDKHGYSTCVPRRDDDVQEEPFVPLQAGYIERAASLLPKAGSKVPWKLKQNYFFDLFMLRAGKVDDGVMQFR